MAIRDQFGSGSGADGDATRASFQNLSCKRNALRRTETEVDFGRDDAVAGRDEGLSVRGGEGARSSRFETKVCAGAISDALRKRRVKIKTSVASGRIENACEVRVKPQ